MNKIEEAVVSYNHDAEGVLEGILINGTPIHETLQSLPEDKGNLILAEARAHIQANIGKATIHDLLLSYVNDRKNNPLIIRQLDEEVIFLYLLGRIFLNEVKDLNLTKMLAKRILAGQEGGESSITKTIEDFSTSYQAKDEEKPMPVAVITIVFTALIGETLRMMKNPMFMIMMMMDR